MRTIYLAGLISPNAVESFQWRYEARTQLAGWRVLIPKDMGKTLGDGIVTPMSSKSLVLKDYHDLSSADVVLVNLELWGETRQSVGTYMELGWAWMLKKPVVAICSEDNRVARRHPFLLETVSEYHVTVASATKHIMDYYGE